MKPVLFALAVGVASIAMAQSSPLEQAFGTLPAQSSVRLSPDGTKLAYLVAQKDRAESLVVTNVATKESKVVMSVDGKPLNFAWCNWATNTRLVCDLRARYQGAMDVAAASRILSINADGTDMKLITNRENKDQIYRTNWGGGVLDWFGGEPGTILMDRWYVPVQRTGSLIESRGEGLGVERVDVTSLKRTNVEPPRPTGAEYISDGQGVVRIFGVRDAIDGYSKSAIRYMYRAAGDRDWKQLGVYDQTTRQGFNPYAVDGRNNLVYGLKQHNGRRALVSYTIDGVGPQERIVYANDKVDVDGPVTIGRSRRVIGASYVEERPHIFYIDKDVERVVRSLEKALPNAPIIRVLDVSDDGNKFLIHASRDVEPGTYYLFDRAGKTLAKVLLSHPQLEGVKLAEQKPVQYRAADGTMIPAYLTLPVGSSGKNLPAIVMPHGGPSARDEWGFDWWAQYYAARGFAVLQPNYRGSDGYGEKWLERNGLQSWRLAMNDILDAGRWLVASGTAEPRKLAIVGWSYGGYAALQTAVVDPDLFKSIVAVAPVTDFTLLREQYRLRTDFFIARDFIGSDLKDGSPAQNAAALKAPVLIFHPTQDQNVSYAQGKLMADRLKDAGKTVTFITYADLGHQLESSEARADMLAKSDAFLRTSLGLK
jgi:dipeptidyl aminopeptidase/acylaminoacyl peptidase